MEVGIGQYFQSGGITVWQQIAPLFKGIGIGTITITFIQNCYYCVILAWAILYMYNSFSSTVPWSTCDNWWNTEKCWTPLNNASPKNGSVNSVTEFWERKILQVCGGVFDLIITFWISGRIIFDKKK